MRLVSYLENDRERLGVERAGGVLPATDLVPDGPATIGQLLAGGASVTDRLRATATDAAEDAWTHARPLDARLAPITRPGKIVAVGLNYHAHAAEQGGRAPDEPMLFAKFPTALVGHRATVRWDPALTDRVDYEAELGVVIGRAARRVSEAHALEHVLGYTCLNDVTARDLQQRDGQFVRSKSLDTFCPMGPALVTADDIPDPQALDLSCTVNGELRQSTSTGDMIFSVAELVAFCSRAFTLEPGDVIATGTPSGVGVFRDPPSFLADGDEMTIAIDHIGRLTNRCAVGAGLERG